jgi:hypothetical protein
VPTAGMLGQWGVAGDDCDRGDGWDAGAMAGTY